MGPNNNIGAGTLAPNMGPKGAGKLVPT